MSNPFKATLRSILTLSSRGVGAVVSNTLPALSARGITLIFNATAAASSPTLAFVL